MSEALIGKTTELIIGREVACSDGVCGDLRRVIVAPAVSEVTHLAIEPKHGLGSGRLAPIALVEVTGEEISLRCTLSEFDALEEADEFVLTKETGGQWVFGPSFGIGMGGGIGGMGMGGARMGNAVPEPHAVASDHVPTGDIELQRGDHVHATDGDIGRVQGLVISSRDQRVIAVLLAEGHLWGQKQVLIPISAITSVDDGVMLNLTKDEVRDLPPSDRDHSE
jgi:sporulation protein YlmC with PRC-barrel domain